MSRAQNSPKGLIVKNVIQPTTLDLSGNLALAANTTGITISADYVASLPGNVDSNIFLGFLYNSTGRAAIINSTGTTHKYLNTTSKQPT